MNGRSDTLFEIVTSSEEVVPYVDAVREAADAETGALGFFPASVYGAMAREGCLFIARERRSCKYAGHLLFDASFPRAKVLQIHSAPAWRRQGVAQALLAAAVDRLTRESYLALQARVAEDLYFANEFWDSQGFDIQRIENGRGKRARRIVVRIRELESPQLLQRSAVSSSRQNILGLRLPDSSGLPLYLVDLNVLFDLAHHRVRHEIVKDLFRLMTEGHCRLAVSVEVQEELRRTTRNANNDPMLELVDALPQLEAPDQPDLRKLCDELAPLVFPDQIRDGALSANDLSDLVHLGVAIANGLAGFVTSDHALLRVAATIRARFGLRVLSPDVFKSIEASPIASRSVTTSAHGQLLVRTVDGKDEADVKEMLLAQGVGQSDISSNWMPALSRSARSGRRLGAWIDGRLLGYVAWHPRMPGSLRIEAFAAVDEQHVEASDVARCLLRTLVEQVRATGPSTVCLHLSSHRSELRERAYALGFYSPGSQATLVKVTIGKVLTSATWNDDIVRIAEATGLKFPSTPPPFSGNSTHIQICSPDGERRFLTLGSLETTLSPVIFVLQGRPAVVTPIKRSFAERLLGHPAQASMLPDETLELHSERHFISGPNAIKHLRPGTLMLFYETGADRGEKGIIAIARVTGAFLTRRDELDVSRLHQSVLTEEAVRKLGRSPTKTVTVFDNVFRMRRPVPLARLKTIGCGEPNDVITTRPITSIQLEAILREGTFDD